MMYDNFGWEMPWVFPFMGSIIFIFTILVGGIYLLKIILGNKDEEIYSQLKPLEILKQRYARGEIDQATYELMKKELN